VGSRVTDSSLYAHLWGTQELRAVFDERPRIQCWLDILAELARAQAEFGIVPLAAAEAIARGAKVELLDLDLVARETRRTGHSTLGLIRGLQRILPAEAAEWVYYGATVQDLTDTWTAIAIRRVGAVVWRDLRAIERHLLDLAVRHRDTPMVGRTHGQPGAPITFGLKAAGWADEIRRHLDRLREGASRWLVGQLGDAVGTLAFFGEHGPGLRAAFCRRLALSDPGVSWLSARDRTAEFVHVLAMIAATLARLGNEIYQLQRPEIGELREPALPEGVGSITMPHKRNPEASEHLVTLFRLVRAQADVMLDAMVQEHERDGRAWKVEWVALPEACLLTGAALAFTERILGGLEVDTEAMRRNLDAARGYLTSEHVLARLAPTLGKHRAQALLQEVLAAGRAAGRSLAEALADSAQVTNAIPPEEIRGLAEEPDVGVAGTMVDAVVERAERARASEPHGWP
jgi:adenylosuccinate lyase